LDRLHLGRNCLLNDVIEGKTERAKRRERRCKQLLDDFKDTIGFRNLKEEAMDITLWGTRFGRGYEHGA
jgi:hypothetical protein